MPSLMLFIAMVTCIAIIERMANIFSTSLQDQDYHEALQADLAKRAAAAQAAIDEAEAAARAKAYEEAQTKAKLEAAEQAAAALRQARIQVAALPDDLTAEDVLSGYEVCTGAMH
jgi:ribosomal protein L12E/L44/L45/RPP1/RPP2